MYWRSAYYSRYFLLIVEPKTYRIEEMIRKKKESECVLLYIKWKSYPDKFNCYVFQDEIES